MDIVIYRRLSKQKDGNQYGFDSQSVDINNFLKTVPNHNIIGEYEEFFSGKDIWTNRKELVKAVKYCQEHNTILLVSKVDRLGRDVESVARLLKRVQVRVATMPSANNMTIQIMSVMAEEEARAISQRTKAALAVAKENGVKLGAAATRYKVRNQRRLERGGTVYEEHRERLTAMREKGYTFAEIADRYNDIGIKTAKGCEHTKSSIHRMCKRMIII